MLRHIQRVPNRVGTAPEPPGNHRRPNPVLNRSFAYDFKHFHDNKNDNKDDKDDNVIIDSRKPPNKNLVIHFNFIWFDLIEFLLANQVVQSLICIADAFLKHDIKNDKESPEISI